MGLARKIDKKKKVIKNVAKPPLIAVVGVTASGKSDLAVALALKCNGELVSADSRQIYSSMDIGTAKLRPPKGVRQWMVDIVAPDELYSLQQYQQGALGAIRDIIRRGKLPILVGGTGMYVDAVVDNWDIPKVRPNERLRATLEADLAREGLPTLVRRLRLIDPKSARKIDKKNHRRVIRALEVALTTGTSFVGQRQKGESQFRVLKIGLYISREELQGRLKRRTVSMIRRGLVLETKKLLRKYPADTISLSGIGYYEAGEYLRGTIKRQELIDRIVLRSMQYAKRQSTWWKRDKTIEWVHDWEEALVLAERWLTKS